MNSSLTNSSSSTPVETCVASATARLRIAASGLSGRETPIADGRIDVDDVIVVGVKIDEPDVVDGAGLLMPPASVCIGSSPAAGAGGGVSHAAPPPPPLPPARRRSMYCSPRQAAMARTPAEVTTIVQLRENSSWKRNRIRRGEKLLLRSRPV